MLKKTRNTTGEDGPTKLVKQQVFIQYFVQSLGHIDKACKAAGIARSTYHHWYATDSNFKEQLLSNIEAINDNIEQVIVARALKGDNQLLIFWAKTKMKHRGFVERVENVNINADINIELTEDRKSELLEKFIQNDKTKN